MTTIYVRMAREDEVLQTKAVIRKNPACRSFRADDFPAWLQDPKHCLWQGSLLCMRNVEPFIHLCHGVAAPWADLVRFLGMAVRSRTALVAENLFLRKQLALYRERQAKPRRAADPMRVGLVLLARCFARREALTIVQAATLVRWHRQAFRLLWRWRSRVGRPRLPIALRDLIRKMARDNPTGGEERLAAELLVKLGIRVAPRTVRRSMGCRLGGGERGAAGPRWATFVRNHARTLVACDVCVAVPAPVRVLDVGSRGLVPVTVTAHPPAAWTLQQFREVLVAPHTYRFVLHDRDRSYSPGLDAAVTALGVRVLRQPTRPGRTPSGSRSSATYVRSAWTS